MALPIFNIIIFLILKTLMEKNPEWYLKSNEDPFKEILFFYDEIVGDYLNLNKKFLFLTGLTQIPYNHKKYYYRINNPNKFLNTLNIKFKNTKSRMTRDFLVEFYDDDETKDAHNKLVKIIDTNGKRLFEQIELREKSLFVTLTYPFEINDKFKIILKIQKFILENLFHLLL